MPSVILLLTVVAQQVAASPHPVVFLPGTGGSSLRYRATDDIYWMGPGLLRHERLLDGLLTSDSPDGIALLYAAEAVATVGSAELNQLRLQILRFTRANRISLPDSAVNRIPDGYPIYVDFFDWARSTFDESGFYIAPFDWRLRPAASIEAIDAVVDRACAEGNSDSVILLCHSLGGLVGREYIATHGKGKVCRLITVGTPWLGTPQAARALVRGYDFGIGATVPNRLPGKLNDLVPEIHVRVNDRAFGELSLRSPTRISFLRRSDTRELARSFPSLFLMTPGLESGVHLRSLLRLTPNTDIGCVAEWTSRQFDHFVRQANPREFDWAKKWRSRYMSGEDYGVEHHIIGLVSNPATPKDEQQVLRFSGLDRPRAADLSRSLGGSAEEIVRDTLTSLFPGSGSLLERMAKSPLTLRRRLFRELDRRTWLNVELDEFVPTHFDSAWGDGTVPLYSATAGSVEAYGIPSILRSSRARLGLGTKVSVALLSPGKSHMSAFDDRAVRRIIEQSCKPKRGS